MIRKIVNLKALCAGLALMLAVGAGDAIAQKRPVLRKRTTIRRNVVVAPAVYSVASGSVVRVRMNSTLSSKTANVGTPFTVTVTEPVYSTNGVVVIPTGSTLNGRVNSVTRARNEGKPGAIDASFVSVRLPNGRTRAINGSLTDLEGSTQSDNEGTATGKKMGNRKLIFIGGGGAGGAILGAAIGGGKGALIGGLLGAGGGFLGDRFTKGKEAEVKSGTEFGVYLNQSIALPRFVESGSGNQ
ncbi:MAG: hypothetical protein WKF34_04865 [Pyrinomonadaceae bacterium]